MDKQKLYAIKDEKSELYVQVEITKNIWTFLDKIAFQLFKENWMIDDHYRGEVKNNDYFSFKKKELYLIIVMTNKRAHIMILGTRAKKKLKRLIFENTLFSQSKKIIHKIIM
ncbi:MAG: hypothetical protein AABX98_02935 [Nanoarchaeota archaeon]